MSVTEFNLISLTYTSTTTKATEKKTAEKKNTEDTGVVYEPSKKTESKDTSKVNDYQSVINK